MKALVTGASSGIGRDMALYLSELGHDVIIVARNEHLLHEVAQKMRTKVRVIPVDLTEEENCIALYEKVKDEDIDILINNAGFGEYGKFVDIHLETELNMIDLNIKSVHILTKLFLKDMKRRNSGYILNVSSSASFLPGPLMATYYATKAYVTRLTLAIYEEIKKEKVNVTISVLAPGPVKTNFNKVAKVKNNLQSKHSKEVAIYAINQLFKHQLMIIPGNMIRLSSFFTKILPTKMLLKISYFIQHKKGHH